MRKMNKDMKVRRLYVVNDGAEDVDMAVVGGMLVAMGYRYLRYECDRLRMEWEGYGEDLYAYEEYVMDRICVDEMVFEANGDIDDIIDDLYYITTTKKADMKDMLFIAEVDDGYVELDYDSIVGKVMKDFVEEWSEEEDENKSGGVVEVEVI
jgi:hypothetical protein